MFNVSCIQLTSDNNVSSNLEKTTDLIIASIKKNGFEKSCLSIATLKIRI